MVNNLDGSLYINNRTLFGRRTILLRQMGCRSPQVSRRSMVAGMGGVVAMGLSGCLDHIATYADTNMAVKTVAVESDQDGNFYHPTQENIESGIYSPLTRGLYIYVNHARLEILPDLLPSFIRFFLDDQHEFARLGGYYATDDETQEANIEQFESVLTEYGIDPSTADLAGEIVCSGSNTVAPITRSAGEAFENEYDNVLIAVEPEGTGAGFADFVRGGSDIQSASRHIFDNEVAVAEEEGVTYSYYEVGWDGLAIVVHEDNDWLERITLQELQDIWTFESPITYWSDLDRDFPDEKIELWGRDDASGTFDFFTQEITGQVGNIRRGYSPHTDTGSIMAGVADSQYALGFGGVGYYSELKTDPFGHVEEDA